MPDWLYSTLVVALGFTVLGITGFGSALVAVPLLAWRWPLPEVVALVLMLDAPAALLHGGLNLKNVVRGEFTRLLPGMAAGIVGGLWIARVVDVRWLLSLLGAYVVWAAVRGLRRSPAASPPAPWPAGAAHAAGAAIGLVEMLFGTAGPVVLLWLQRRLDGVLELRATAPVVMLVATLAVLLAMAANGTLSDASLWRRWLPLLAIALAAVFAGNRIARRVSVRGMQRTMACLLVGSGAALVLRALR